MRIIIFLITIFMLSTRVGAQQTLSLEEYRSKVQNYSHVIKQTRQKSIAMEATERVAFKKHLPKLDLTSDASLNLRDMNWSGEGPGLKNVGTNDNPDLTYLPGVYRNYTYSGMLMLASPIYAGGAITANYHMAVADKELAILEEEHTIDRINYQADAIYWNLSSACSVLDAAQEFRSIVELQLNVITERFDDGMIAKTDLLMISTRFQEAELQYISAKQNYELATQQLNVLSGENVNEAAPAVFGIEEYVPSITPYTLNQVLEQRADYRSTMVGVGKMEAVRKAALSSYNPQLNAYIAGGYATQSPNMGADVMFSPIVGLNLTVPIFRWGERLQVSKQQNANILIQELQTSLVYDGISQELAAAITKVRESESMVLTSEKNMQVAQESLDLVTFSYNEGKGSIVDVLSSQLAWIQAKNSRINSSLSHKMAIAEYQKVVSQ